MEPEPDMFYREKLYLLGLKIKPIVHVSASVFIRKPPAGKMQGNF